MAKIHVVTDSGSDLPEQIRQELGIHVVPLTIQFGDEIYRDGVELKVEEFYDRLQNGNVLPSTCQPSPAEFQKTYQEIAEPGDTIISIHLSSRLSGTYQSAVLASTMVEEEGIKVITVDSKAASIGIGLVAITVAKAIRDGASVDEALEVAQHAIDTMQVFFVVDTLEYLKRNGRIGKASALVGTLLSIKPILTLQDGVVAPFEKVRGKAKAIKRILALVQEHVQEHPDKKFRVGVTHGMSYNEAQSFAEALQEVVPMGDEVANGLIGPTIGVHVGPGTIALLFHQVV